MPCIEMSRTMTSGRNVSAALSAALPSCTLPAMTQAGVSTSLARSSMASLSSTRSTRTAVLSLLTGSTVLSLRTGSRVSDCEFRPDTRFGPNLQRPANCVQAFVHADEAEPFPHCGVNIKADAVVDDAQREHATPASQMDGYVVRLTVLERVLQCFLNDAKQAGRQIARQRRRDHLVRESDLDLVLGQLVSKCLQSRNQTEHSQPCRMHTVRQILHALGKILRATQGLLRQIAGFVQLGSTQEGSSIVRRATCWPISSCSSRAMKARSFSCALNRRPPRSRFRS